MKSKLASAHVRKYKPISRTKRPAYRLDKEEQQILDAIERGEWKSVKPSRSEFSRYAQIAKATLRKDQRMNIRISKSDMDRLKIKAAEEGMPYQTLVASVLHKYVSRGNKAA